MNLKHLTDECLLQETKRYVQQERELLTIILHHLREIERRRLFAPHPSLHVYAEKELGYSAPQAHRRVTAARLFNEIPEIEAKIELGQINLTHVGIAHSLFQAERKLGTPLSIDQKMDVFDAMAGQSTRTAQGTANSFATVKMRTKDSFKALGEGRHLFTGELTDEVLAKFDKLKGLLAHIDPNPCLNDLMNKALDHALAQLDPAKSNVRKINVNSKAQIRKQIWRRDGGCCVNCGSNYAVQEDHIVPKSMGGQYTLENMRLLCRGCNQRAGIEKLGLRKMEKYI